ncbi:MAG: DUF190 domain-containing protein [Sediminibacterium sp.]
MIQKLFPKSAYIHIIEDAKAEGILNASVYNTHLGFSNKESIQMYNIESDNSKLTMCVELVDTREKSASFFLKHREYLKGKQSSIKKWNFGILTDKQSKTPLLTDS